MIDREKVIKGLEHELQNRGKCGHYCHDGIETVSCEYDKDGLCIQHWGNDALALLKAQEPRVMTPQDFDGNPMKDQYGNLPCWLESREPLVASNWCRWNEDDFIRPMMRNFRPWTSRPTDEQREATPW